MRIASLGRLVGPLFAAAALWALPVAAAEPQYERTACMGDLGADAARVECGVLSVDEARGSNNGRRVALPVAVVKASAPKRGLPPVYVFHGGPGGGLVEGLARRLRSPAGRELFAIDQDWVIFDQRGGGLSSPALDCGEVALNDAGPLSEQASAELAACAVRHRAAGVDLGRYNIAEIAADVQDLRRALGHERIDLFGASYGTSVELGVMRLRPEGVRAVVLDSVWPPEARWAEDGPKMISDAVALVLARCRSDADCERRHPRLSARFDALATRWLAGPQRVGGGTYTASDLGGFLMDATYSAEGVRRLPADLDRLIGGDAAALAQHVEGRSGYLEAQHLTHLCKEEFPFENRAGVARNAGRDPVARLTVASFERYFDVCRAFDVGQADPAAARAITSDIPTLMLAAEIDPGCPPDVARRTIGGFRRGQLLVAPNATHGVYADSPCARRAIRAFFADPSQPADGSCLAADHPRLVFEHDS